LSLNNFTTECMHFLLARPWVARLPICHALYEPPTHALYEPPTHALYEPPTHALYEPPTHALYEMLTHRGHDAREAACQWSASKNGSVNKAPEHMPGRWRCAVANTCTHLICGTSALPGQSFACAVHRRTSTVPKPLSQAHSYKSLAPTAAPPLCAASTGWAVGSRGPGAAAPQGYRLTAPQSVIWCSCWGPAIDGALASMPPAHLPLRCQALAAGGRRSRHTYGIPRSSGRGWGSLVTLHPMCVAARDCCGCCTCTCNSPERLPKRIQTAPRCRRHIIARTRAILLQKVLPHPLYTTLSLGLGQGLEAGCGGSGAAAMRACVAAKAAPSAAGPAEGWLR